MKSLRLLLDIHKRRGLSGTCKHVLTSMKKEGIAGIRRRFMLSAEKLITDRSQIHSLASELPPSRSAKQLFPKNVLIVAELSIAQCKRYRVTHRVEALTQLGFHCKVLPWNEYDQVYSELATVGVVIFYRVPGYERVIDLIKCAHALKVDVYWEVDDLIFSEEVLKQTKTFQHLSSTLQRESLQGAKLYRRAMLACGQGIASTPVIADYMQRLGLSHTSVVRNALDSELLQLRTVLKKSRDPADIIRICYGSGTSTHDIDFCEVSDALEKLLSSYPHLKLRIVGDLRLPKNLLAFSRQIEIFPKLSFKEYLEKLYECDIAIAPLEDSIFNHGKSAIKFIEASTLSIPCVCSDLTEFRALIEDGVNGFLCSTTEQWEQALEKLITSHEIRKQISQKALETVTSRCSLSLSHSPLSFIQLSGRGREDGVSRILSVNIYYPPQNFGGATVVAEALNNSISQDCDIRLFSLTGRESAGKNAGKLTRYEWSGLPVLSICHGRSELCMHDEEINIRGRYEQILNATEPSLVYVHSLGNLGLTLPLLCAERKIPYFVFCHDTSMLTTQSPQVSRTGSLDSALTRLKELCLKDNSNVKELRLRVLANASKIFCPSRFFTDLFREFTGMEQISTLLNGIDLQTASVTRQLRKKNRQSIMSEMRKLRFGYLGGISELKGFSCVVSLSRLITELGAELYFADNSSSLNSEFAASEMKRHCPMAKIINTAAPATIEDFYREIDVLLFPSQVLESFGLAVREAVARGIFVLTSSQPSLEGAIIEGVNGLSVAVSEQHEQFIQDFKTALHDALPIIKQHQQIFLDEEDDLLVSSQIRDFSQQAEELLEITKRQLHG